MKNIILSITALILFLSLSCSQSGVKIYVSPDGDDAATGSSSNPVKSLAVAAELAKPNAGTQPVTIILDEGTFELTKPLVLGNENSGTKEAPVVWKARKGTKPVVSGGIIVNEWKQENNGIWSATLPPAAKSFRSLYVNGKRATRARFPNEDYLRVGKAGEDNRTNFFFNKNDFPKIKTINGLELVFLHDWSITRIHVKSIDWEKNQLFAVDSIGSRLDFFGISNWEKHPRYFLENAIEFLDQPGEWYCDFEKGKIYYLPQEGEEINSTTAVIPVAEKLLVITGDENNHAGFINFEGITFEHTNWQIPSTGYCGVQACMFDNREKPKKGWNVLAAAIELDLADNCTFNNCTIRHTGGSGVWFHQNCSDCQISNSQVYDISGNGINIGEGRNRFVNGEPWWQAVPDEVSKNNKISNCLISDCGKQFYGAVGIWGGLVANTVIDHNKVRNMPYTGISIGWMWEPTPTPCAENMINANHIHNILQTLSDGGGIYSLGLQPNSKITNNLIHDVTVNAGRAESNGMFLDEGTKDVLVANNIIYNIARSPLRFHKASENTVQNNILVCGEGTPPIRYNRTPEKNITKINNTVLSQVSDEDMEKLQAIIKERIGEIGLRR